MWTDEARNAILVTADGKGRGLYTDRNVFLMTLV